MTDVAKRAGVAPATVDRVLNERANVSDQVRIKVINAARELGLRRVLPSAYRRMVRINVILARPDRPLIARMASEMRRLGQRLDPGIKIHRTILSNEAPATIAKAMLAGSYDAVVVDAPDSPLIHDAIKTLKSRDCPVVCLISDVPGSDRLAYAGTDHYKAGRSAGFFLTKMIPASTPGKIVVLCHNIGFHAHAERIRGLSDHLAQSAPHLAIADILRGDDDAAKSESLLRDAFVRHPTILGVYNAGAGNRGVVAAIKAGLLPQPPLFIGHELTPFTYESLKSGLMTLTIDQSPELQSQYAIEVVMNHFGFQGATLATPPYVSDVPIVLYGPENLPDVPPAAP